MHHLISERSASFVHRRSWMYLVCGVAIGLAGCNSLNPAFVNLIDTSGTGAATLDNAPGHVVVTLVNNAQVDESLLSFLRSQEGGPDFSGQVVHPRIRLRVRITFTDGTFQVVEFIDGNSDLVDPTQDASAFPDLNQNDLNIAVGVCDVASVMVDPGSAIEVFMPVPLEVFQQVNTTNTVGGTLVQSVRRMIRPAQFVTLRTDDVDAENNTILQRNIGIRDVPSSVLRPRCGSVIAIVVDGTLSVPFLTGVSSNPSYDQDDDATVAQIGGRYEFRVSVQ